MCMRVCVSACMSEWVTFHEGLLRATDWGHYCLPSVLKINKGMGAIWTLPTEMIDKQQLEVRECSICIHIHTAIKYPYTYCKAYMYTVVEKRRDNMGSKAMGLHLILWLDKHSCKCFKYLCIRIHFSYKLQLILNSTLLIKCYNLCVFFLLSDFKAIQWMYLKYRCN